MIIGIGGCSRSGKSTLTDTLIFAFRMRNKQIFALHIDDFVKKVDDIPYINDTLDWESSDSIDLDLLMQAIYFYQNKVDILIIEGCHFFNFKELVSLSSVQILIEIEEMKFKLRRKIEKRWGEENDWYLNHVWDIWQKNGKKYLKVETTIFLDEENMNQINNLINQIESINAIRR